DEVGRFGGDEFIVLMDESTNDQRFRYMHATINKTIFEIDSEKVFIHLSMGIALYPKEGTTSFELLEVADRRLYHAKLQGKGRVCSEG
ncbi:MAG: GGDEF domain-containing protein, partial [Spirochaetia bacterium]|nr:GGDEF domain-containing protein [Spirochaetia bacterium]